MKYGKCPLCQSKVVDRMYKLKDSQKDFRRFFVCEKTTKHSMGPEELRLIDADFYKRWSNDEIHD